jgi:hypothetical protein
VVFQGVQYAGCWYLEFIEKSNDHDRDGHVPQPVVAPSPTDEHGRRLDWHLSLHVSERTVESALAPMCGGFPPLDEADEIRGILDVLFE